MCEQSALARINEVAACLTAPQYRTARRLLDCVGADGTIRLEREQCRRLCNTSADGTMRAHLIALSRHGIIKYFINRQVYIQFWPAWQPETRATVLTKELTPDEFYDPIRAQGDGEARRCDHKFTKRITVTRFCDPMRAQGDHMSPDSPEYQLTIAKIRDHMRALGDHILTKELTPVEICDPIRASSDPIRALGDPILTENEGKTAPTYTRARAQLVSKLDPILSTIEENNLLTNSLNPNIDKVEQSVTFALLCQIRVKSVDAKRLATIHPLARVREAVSHWWFNRKSMGGEFGETPGIVVYWLDKWNDCSVPALDDRFLRTDLYRRFQTDAERDSEPAVEPLVETLWMDAAPPPATVLPPVPDADPQLGKLWATIVSDYPPTTQHFLKMARLIRIEDQQAVIHAPRAAAQWLQLQLHRRLVRSFAVTGRPVSAVLIEEVQL